MVKKEMTMPRLGESVTEGTIVDWLVQVGDHVEEYDPICEVQTVKVVAEVPSSFTGTITKVLAATDDTIAVGAPLAEIAVEGAVEESAPAADTATSATSETSAEPATPDPAPVAAAQPAVDSTDAPRFSPAVASLLAKYRLHADDIPATGHQGRLTRQDVENFMAEEVSQPAPAAAHQAASPVPTPTPVQNTGFDGQLPGDIITPGSSVRKAIAAHMSQSKNEIPHGWMMVEQDVSNIVVLRQKEKANFQKREGFKLTYFPFFVKAVAQALAKHPRINSSWQNNMKITHKQVNISIAVAKGDELFVPVIKHADDLSIKGIAAEINRLASAVRNGTATADDMQGGTFTVNNTGSFGSVASMGIINYPQAAIIQIESIRKAIQPTPDGRGFTFADMVNLSLSVDHRLLDGVAAGGFLKDVKKNLAAYGPDSNLY
ncbi:dihydrolipoamide acetyltransferase family protein [Agrilactobacillus composti]|uniref:dihydrolipoamide acetyltransferase family protein n=1 Tax=Agrilactobacillus composti TaxID=398555 RepID=UPI0012678623|nr:dihydrolipoamide acetyltransferase family protein [Agrilactobacillus composti]